MLKMEYYGAKTLVGIKLMRAFLKFYKIFNLDQKSLKYYSCWSYRWIRTAKMNTIFKNYFFYLWKEAATYNNSILALHIEPQEKARILDIGSDSGELITERVQNIKKPEIYGIDLRKEAINKSKKIGIKALVGNVEDGLPFKSSFFDIVSANQIIEHLRDLDFFL